MKKNKHNWLLPALGCLAGYILLLVLLTIVEKSDPNASIVSFSDALWYSLITLSTVGYGDLYPVTAVGKVLGILFVFMSVGLLSFLVGAVVSLFSGRMLPAIRLWLARKRPWYIFSQYNAATHALTLDLASHDPDAVFLFPDIEAKHALPGIRCCVYYGTVEQTASRKKDDCKLFFLHEQLDELSRAVAAASLGHPVYCRSAYAPDQKPENLTLFSVQDCCAQEYWRRFTIGSDEKTVVLIGNGAYAQQLLEKGLLVNVFGDAHTVCYHVFGDWDHFKKNHQQLGMSMTIDRIDENTDCLLYHHDSWNADATLLYRADRIILCADEQEVNLDILEQLRRYFPVKGNIHLRSDTEIPGATVFGTHAMIYTREIVVQDTLTLAARTMHQIYCESAQGNAPSWKDLSEFLRQSNIAAADHLLTKVRLLLNDNTITRLTKENCAMAYTRYCEGKAEDADRYRRIEHLRWMRFHSMYHWRYSPVRDNAARFHPMMVPYDQLTYQEQIKDDYAWELLDLIAKSL